MAEEVEQLVLAHFREIVEKGKTAIENVESAGDEAPALMLKSAQSLVKEGERALKKIEPISTAYYEEYGIDFINAVKENAEITQFRSELVELLWEFDDYIEAADFDAEKFDELQRASKNAALRILDILKRMRLVTSVPTSSSRPTSMTGPPMSTNIYKRPDHEERLIKQVGGQTDEPSIIATRLSSGAWSSTEIARLSSPIDDLDGLNLHRSNLCEPPSEPPPTPPSDNPWHVGRVASALEAHPEEADAYIRGPRVAPDSPTIPKTQLVGPDENLPGVVQPQETEDGTMRGEQEQRMRAASQSLGSPSEGSLSPLQSRRWTNSTQGSTESVRSPTRSPAGLVRNNEAATIHTQRLESVLNRIPSGASPTSGNPTLQVYSPGRDRGNQLANNVSFPPRTTSVANQNSSSYTLSSRKPSTESINSSVFDVVESLSPADRTTASLTHRQSVRTTGHLKSTSLPPPSYPGPPPLYQTPPVPPRRTSAVTIGTQSSGEHTALGLRGIEEGLIPVDMEGLETNEMPVTSREPDCTITPASSFYKLKGFCDGAREAQRGQPGFKRIKRPIGGFSTVTVAKCTHCLFERDYKSVEQDLNNESAGNNTSNTVGFRLRILQKSHLPVRVINEQLYACLFCIEAGHTIEESDATVFFSQKQLFAHMARHPQPLPKVFGITVIEGIELPPQVKDNYDLHFPHPPTNSVMAGIGREVARLPSAVTTETRRMTHGTIRMPPDRQPPLHFAIGAKIVGIEFPPKYDGKWAIGWHDGVRAAFEMDTVQLDAPPKTEVKMQGTSSVQAVARWKWNQKGDERWLKFDKGDVIKNISWFYADHWCWSGTTSKGFGIFPQSHLDPNSIRLNDTEDAGSVASWEKKTPLKFSFRSKKDDHKIGSFGKLVGP